VKLIDVSMIQGRVNSILLALEEQGPEAAREQLVELRHGLDFYAEAAPRTAPPGVKTKRKPRKAQRHR